MASELGFKLKIDGVEKTIQTLGDLRQAIKDLTKEAQNTDLGSKAYDDVQARIKDARAEFVQFKNDTRAKEVKDQFVELGSGVSSSLDTATTALTLFGSESKAVQAISEKASGALVIANNLLAISELKVTAGTVARMAVEKAATAGTWLLNAANKALNTTLKANPMGFLVTVIGLAVAAIAGLITWVASLSGGFEKLAEKIRNVASALTFGLIDDTETKKSKKRVNEMIEKYNEFANKIKSVDETITVIKKQELKLLEAQGASEKVLHEKRLEIIDSEKQALINSKKEVDDAIEKAKKRTGEEYENILKIQGGMSTAIKEFDKEKEIENARYNKAIRDQNKAAAEKNAAEKKAADDKATQLAEQHKKEMLDIEKKSIEEYNAMVGDWYLNSIQNQQEYERAMLDTKQDNIRQDLVNRIKAFEDIKVKTEEELKAYNALTAQYDQLLLNQEQEKRLLLEKQEAEKNEAIKSLDQDLYDSQAERYIASRDRYISFMDMFKAKTYESANYMQEIIMKEAEMQIAEATRTKDERVKQLDNLVLSAEEKASKIAQIEQDLADQTVQINQEAADKKKKINMDAAMAIAETTANVLSAVASLFGENTEAFKVFKVAETIISTLSSAVKAYESTVGVPIVGPVLAPIAAGAALVSGYANVKKILSTDTGESTANSTSSAAAAKTHSTYAKGGLLVGPSHAGGGIQSPFGELEGGEFVINKRSTQMYGGLISAINQAGGGKKYADGGVLGSTGQIANLQGKIDSMIMGQGDAPIVKAYVLSSEVTDAQTFDVKTKRYARL